MLSGTYFYRKVLETVFDEVIMVDVLDSGDSAHLTLMKRPELGITLTKLHCWSLTQYSKCVFMDADTLVSVALRAEKMCIVVETCYSFEKCCQDMTDKATIRRSAK